MPNSSLFVCSATVVGREAKTWGEKGDPAVQWIFLTLPHSYRYSPESATWGGLAGRMARTKQIQGPRQEGQSSQQERQCRAGNQRNSELQARKTLWVLRRGFIQLTHLLSPRAWAVPRVSYLPGDACEAAKVPLLTLQMDRDLRATELGLPVKTKRCYSCSGLEKAVIASKLPCHSLKKSQ